jgi:hypothetical protein
MPFFKQNHFNRKKKQLDQESCRSTPTTPPASLLSNSSAGSTPAEHERLLTAPAFHL